jgi:hypothetical protein
LATEAALIQSYKYEERVQYKEGKSHAKGYLSLANSFSKTNQMYPVSHIYLFLNNTLHVSDDLSAHHQEFETVHTATGICQKDTATCLLAVTS